MPTTPYSQLLDAGIYTIAMPPSIVIGTDTYLFSTWETGAPDPTNPTRTIDLTAGNVSVLATYVLYVPRQTLSVDSSPVTAITFTLTRVA